MRVLLDTHVLLWWLMDDPGLGEKARSVISQGTNDLFVSAVSAWEISIKQALGKLHVPANLETTLMGCGFALLPIGFRHAFRAGRLPPHHQDPFDRMLVAQALTENMELLTHDKTLRKYGVKIIAA